MAQVVLVSNGPGELYTWVGPVVRELRRALPDARVAVSLVPCQFAAGNEPEVARSFGPDHVATPGEYLRALAAGSVPAGLADAGAGPGAVVGLGGSPGAPVTMALVPEMTTPRALRSTMWT